MAKAGRKPKENVERYPNGAITDAFRVEKEVHRKLKNTCIHNQGEWYFLNEKAAQFAIITVMRDLGCSNV